MAWTLFNWGSRGPTWDTGGGVYVAFIPIPNCVQVNLKGHDEDGNELLHVFDVIKSGAPPVYSDCLNIALAVKGWVNTDFKTYLRDDTHVDQIVATSRAEVNGPQATVGLLVTGVRATVNPLPSEVTVALKKSSLRAGRSYRGRFFAWPFMEADLQSPDANQVTTEFAALVAGVYSNLIDAMHTGGWELGVASNVLAQVNPVESITMVDLTIDRQGRRSSGRGA